MRQKILIFFILLQIIRVSIASLDPAEATSDDEVKRLVRSEEIRKYMNESVNPCENFYEFACGNWRTHHPASSERLETYALHLLDEDFNHKLTELLISRQANDTAIERLPRDFYASCLQAQSLKMPSSKGYLRKLLREFGVMPALTVHNVGSKKFDWIKTVAEISHKYGIHIIFQYSIESYLDNTNEIIIGNQEFALEDTTGQGVNDYKLQVEKDLIQFLGIKRSTAKRTAMAIAKFEALLVKAAAKNDGKRHSTTFASMQKRYSPALNVKKMFSIAHGFVPSGTIYEDNPNYMKSLGQIMKQANRKTVANYIFYHLMRSFKVIRAATAEEQQKTCLTATQTTFGDIISDMIYRSYGLNETEQQYKRIWQDIANTFQDILESKKLSWFDDEARENALEKLHMMKLHIATFEGYNFEAAYKGLNITASSYGENLKALKKFNARKHRALYGKSTDSDPVDVNFFTEYYIINANKIVISVAPLLTDFSLSASSPHAFKYSRIGWTLSHEGVHGFSATGRHYDRMGRLMRSYRSPIELEYEQRRQCFYDQYHDFYLDGKPLPQDSAQGENASDNVGILLAYQTYMRWLNDTARTKAELARETLPQLNYTNKQLFFIGYTQLWCADTHSSYEMDADEEHSPDSYRGFVPLLNFVEFSKEFSCPLGSPMNPYKKCTIF